MVVVVVGSTVEEVLLVVDELDVVVEEVSALPKKPLPPADTATTQSATANITAPFMMPTINQ